MQVYVARLGSEGIYDDPERAGEIVGIFAVDRFEDLFWMVDQACDPGAVEVAVLGAGGVYWEKQTALKLPVPADEDGEPLEEFSGLPGNASLCEEWHEPFFQAEGIKWRPLVAPGSTTVTD